MHLLIVASQKLASGEETQELKICLYHAIGKFTRHNHEKTEYIHNISLYIMYEEFDTLLSDPKSTTNGPETYVLLALLGILDNEVRPCLFRLTPGSLLKSLVLSYGEQF